VLFSPVNVLLNILQWLVSYFEQISDDHDYSMDVIMITVFSRFTRLRL